MKRETLKKFQELNALLESEVKEIAYELLESHDTYEDALETLVEYFESDSKLEDLIYSEIYKKMIKQATN